MLSTEKKATGHTRIVSDDDLMVLRTEKLSEEIRTNVTVANHVSINVKQGEIVGLLGRRTELERPPLFI